jgi:hypothetical protein
MKQTSMTVHRYEPNVDPAIGKVNVCLFCSEVFNHPNHIGYSPSTYTTFPDERLVYRHRNGEALVTAIVLSKRSYVAVTRDGYRTDYPHTYDGPASNDTRVFWDNPEYFTKGFKDKAYKAIRAHKGL